MIRWVHNLFSDSHMLKLSTLNVSHKKYTNNVSLDMQPASVSMAAYFKETIYVNNVSINNRTLDNFLK